LIIEAYHPSQHWIPIGQVRFNQYGEIGVSLSRAFRGQRLATPAIETGICYLKHHSTLESVFAHIKEDNSASARAFERAGFRLVCETAVEGQACRAYAYQIRDRPSVNVTSVSTPGK
jgi:RimJ/RimL family protein N-acetyltransferase